MQHATRGDFPQVVFGHDIADAESGIANLQIR
jgi:hypothetical protein